MACRWMLLAGLLHMEGAPAAQAAEDKVQGAGQAMAIAGDTAGVPDDATLEAAGARIGVIHIRSLQIFDTSDPDDDRAIFRLANRLHVNTHERAIRAQLLFRPGQRYSRPVLEETERNLRQLQFLREPHIRPVAWHDGLVDIEVVTQDVWTLQPGVSFSRSGGANRSGIEFSDQNLLGTGKGLEFGRTSDVDRRSDYVTWRDPNVWGSRWRDSVQLADSDDGRSWLIDVEHPFYSLATRWSGGTSVGQTHSTISRYVLGERYDDYTQQRRSTDVWLGHRLPDSRRWTQHLTLGYREQRTANSLAGDGGTLAALPGDLDLRYPYLRYELVEDDYQTISNQDLIARTEDLHFGWAGSIEVGWASPRLDADRTSRLLTSSLSYGIDLGERQSLFLASAWSGRREFGATHNELASADLRYYFRTSARTRFYLRAHADAGHRLDTDNYLELGGDNGLRGYPLRYLQGSGRALFTLEERFYSDWYLFRLLHVGAAAFFDAGRTWGQTVLDAPTLGWQRDAGIGLRLGNSRTSFGSVIHVDLATPLDGDASLSRLQLLVGTQATF